MISTSSILFICCLILFGNININLSLGPLLKKYTQIIIYLMEGLAHAHHESNNYLSYTLYYQHILTIYQDYLNLSFSPSWLKYVFDLLQNYQQSVR